MYTREEKQQLENLEATCDVLVETIIRQHEGGYVITHTRRFGQNDIIVGQMSTVHVAYNAIDICDVIDKLYPPDTDILTDVARPN